MPAGYAALRARYARLRGEVREAAAWAREGLCTTASARSGPAEAGVGAGAGEAAEARAELALAEAQSPALASVRHPAHAPHDPYDAVRLGTPERAAGRLTGVFAAHADALTHSDGPALDRAAGELERRGFLLFSAEAYAQAAAAHRDPGAARTARTRAVALARRCQGARTPALAAAWPWANSPHGNSRSSPSPPPDSATGRSPNASPCRSAPSATTCTAPTPASARATAPPCPG
ncbi:hypothetical protein SHIRM173S_02399 [Streptomyces hirsutus]